MASKAAKIFNDITETAIAVLVCMAGVAAIALCAAGVALYALRWPIVVVAALMIIAKGMG